MSRQPQVMLMPVMITPAMINAGLDVEFGQSGKPRGGPEEQFRAVLFRRQLEAALLAAEHREPPPTSSQQRIAFE